MAEFNNLIDQLTVLQRQDLTSTEKFVAIVILSFRNSQNGRCNPPIVSKTKGKETVCTRTGFSDVCVQKAIKGLEQKGVFSVSRELGQTSFFEFTGTNEVSKGANEVSTGTNDITPNEVSKGTNEVSTGANDISTGTNDTHPNEVSTSTNEVFLFLLKKKIWGGKILFIVFMFHRLSRLLLVLTRLVRGANHVWGGY